MELLLCVSQVDNKQPYRFAGTGIQVYSFEEVLYHVYHYWKQSIDEITAPALIAWIHDILGLNLLAAKLSDIADIEDFSRRMLAFLSITPYFSEAELDALKPQFELWEKRLEWETYKERADDLMMRGEPDRAVPLYRYALAFDKNIVVLNNLGIAYMQIEAFAEACTYLEQALEIDENNWELLLHYAEALIYAERLDEAKAQLKKAAKLSPEIANGDLLYLQGELMLRKGKQNEAIALMEQAIAITPEEQYVFSLADIYASRRQFEKALDIMTSHLTKAEGNIIYYMKEAELYRLSDNLPRAIAAVQKALSIRPDNVDLLIRLAEYYRLDYNLEGAETAIGRALAADSGNEKARLEYAKIKKGIGDAKLYRNLLKDMLRELRHRYREVH